MARDVQHRVEEEVDQKFSSQTAMTAITTTYSSTYNPRRKGSARRHRQTQEEEQLSASLGSMTKKAQRPFGSR